MSEESRKRKSFKFPHTYVTLFLIIVIMAALTYVVPAGEFERYVDEATGVTYVDAESYHRVEQSPVGIFELFLSIQLGFVDASSVIFLIFFAYFTIYTIIKTGAFHGAVGKLMKSMDGKEKYIIPLFMIIFALAGSTYGEWDTVYGLIPIFIGLAIALGYDALVGLAMSGMAVAVGFASATTNPFSIGIAQSIAELPIFSGLMYRSIAFIVFVGLSIWWTMRYANKVKDDPSKSYVKEFDFGSMQMEQDSLEDAEFNGRHKLILITLFVTIFIIVFGSLNWGWYLDEMSGAFLLSGIVISIIWGFKPDEIAKNFIDGCSEIVIGAMVTGIARSILIIIQNGNIIDTIIYAMYLPLSKMPNWIAAQGMLIFQNIMNIFIPSGSGQAAAAMPIMVPLSDALNINRQIAVLAYQFGDGYSNLLWPTCGIATMVSIAKIPLDKWYKFFLPFFGIMYLVQVIFMFIASMINYGPF